MNGEWLSPILKAVHFDPAFQLKDPAPPAGTTNRHVSISMKGFLVQPKYYLQKFN